jgi:uncharacterized membrane protein YphA (DoxX/SURF4 family)
MAWSTAWSFDRLRLWLEEGLEPAHALRQTLVHWVARGALALVFTYQGVVPKLLGPNPDEIAMLRDAAIPARLTGTIIASLGFAELAFAACLLIFLSRRWPAVLCLALMTVATIAVASSSPQYLSAAFNPVTLNLAVAALAVVDLIVLSGVPSAARCRRSAKE